jgi:AraC family ethanolamine operon transcriptional activator
VITKTGQAIVAQARFDDFEAYESAVQGWSWTVRKLDTAPFSAHLLQVSVGPIRMAWTQLDTTIAVSGAAQAGLASFGIPLPGSPPAMWCRREASSRTVSVFESSGAFEAVMRPGFETVVFSVEPEHLDEMAESLGYDTPRRIFPSAEVTRCDPEHMRALHRLLHEIRSHLARDSSLLQRPGLREALEFEVPRRLLSALAEKAPVSRAIEPHLRQRALRRALDHIAAHPRDPVGVEDLCRSTGASARTLRRAFAAELGVAPKAYIQAHRLDGVRRELRCSDSGENSVNAVAHRWGFWHMSQFAADYRRWFGELPSETLSRPPPGGGGTSHRRRAANVRDLQQLAMRRATR